MEEVFKMARQDQYGRKWQNNIPPSSLGSPFLSWSTAPGAEERQQDHVLQVNWKDAYSTQECYSFVYHLKSDKSKKKKGSFI